MGSPKGQFNANSMLLFPEESSLEIVRKMLGEGYLVFLLESLSFNQFKSMLNKMINRLLFNG